jgi:serine/threonine protein kinase
MITEKLHGVTLYEFQRKYPESRVPLATALEIGIGLVRGLKRLHSLDIVHNDIHPGNIFLESSMITGLKFIDFGRAFKSEPSMLRNILVERPGENFHRWYSHWKILGFLSGKREDLFRAIQAIAIIVNGSELLRYEHHLQGQEQKERLVHWKVTGFWFEIPKHAYSPINSLDISDDAKNEIRKHLSKMMEYVRDLNDIAKPLPYDEVIQLLQATKSVIEAGSQDSPEKPKITPKLDVSGTIDTPSIAQ